MRRIVVRGEQFRWQVNDTDWGMRVVAVAPRGRLLVTYHPSALITPHAVRRAIERALDEGWTEGEHRLDFGDVDDREVAVPAPPAVSDEEAALLDAGDLAVYADWLLERGDPQGELIAHGDASLQAKVLGPVGLVTHAQVWDRGLLVGARLFRRNNGVVTAAIGHRAWRTMRDLDARAGTLSVSDTAKIVGHPVMRDLRRLLTSERVLDRLGNASFPRLTHLAIDGPPMFEIDAPLEVICARVPDVLRRPGGVYAPFWQDWDHPGPTASRQDGKLIIAWEGVDHPFRRAQLLEGIATCDLPRVVDATVPPDLIDALH